MRSLAPLASEIVPPPVHAPDKDANGPAPWAWACAVNRENASANAPHELRITDDIEADGMDPLRRAASAGSVADPQARRCLYRGWIALCKGRAVLPSSRALCCSSRSEHR